MNFVECVPGFHLFLSPFILLYVMVYRQIMGL